MARPALAGGDFLRLVWGIRGPVRGLEGVCVQCGEHSSERLRIFLLCSASVERVVFCGALYPAFCVGLSERSFLAPSPVRDRDLFGVRFCREYLLPCHRAGAGVADPYLAGGGDGLCAGVGFDGGCGGRLLLVVPDASGDGSGDVNIEENVKRPPALRCGVSRPEAFLFICIHAAE